MIHASNPSTLIPEGRGRRIRSSKSSSDMAARLKTADTADMEKEASPPPGGEIEVIMAGYGVTKACNLSYLGVEAVG